MFKSYLKRIAPLILPTIVLFAVFSIGIYLGFENRPWIERVYSLSNKGQPINIKTDFEPFWKTWMILNDKFVSSATSTTDQERVWGAIQGMTNSLGDPYTVFLPPEETTVFQEDISGGFEGVGMEIGIRDRALTVVSPLKDSPAYKAGILPGDKILKIDGMPSIDLPVEKAVKLIRGKGGTEVKLTIGRNGKEPFLIGIVRGPIIIPAIDTEFKDEVFIIKLFNFSAVTPNLFREALRGFIESGTDKLILDLRGNPGGYLEAAVDMASWFLPAGKVIVREDFGGKADEIVYRSKGYNIFTDQLKFVILVNNGSASASEILAGALREHGKAIVVGSKTFGKGSVQELINITSDSSLKVTIARWLTPKGNSISDGGLKPDIEIDLKPDDVKNGRDPQLAKAIEALKAK